MPLSSTFHLLPAVASVCQPSFLILTLPLKKILSASSIRSEPSVQLSMRRLVNLEADVIILCRSVTYAPNYKVVSKYTVHFITSFSFMFAIFYQTYKIGRHGVVFNNPLRTW